MFFTLKKKLMCRAIEKRNRQHPFDYAAAENYTLAPDSDPLVNNSYYFSARDEKMSLFARLGKRVHQDETWFALYLDGQLYSLKQELFPVGAREYGLLTIVNVKGATKVLKNGDHIVMNADKGTIMCS